MSFEALHREIRELLADEGFEEPTPAQAGAMPPILAGKHTLLLAPTGMGKTESAVLPMLDELLSIPDEEREGFVALYVTPLRALNRDIMGRLHAWCDRLGIRIGVRHGDTSRAERRRQSKDPPEFLITTPETLQALFTGHRLRGHLAGVRFVVIDEIHELVGNERGAQLACALERLVRYSGEFQRVGLSATVGNPEEAAGFLGGKDREVEIVQVPVGKDLEVSVEYPEPTDEDVTLARELMTDPAQAALVRRMVELIEANTSTLVFVNTRRMAEVLAARLAFMGREDVAVHHGSLHKDERVRVETAFKQGEKKGLICTSSMELGIDIGSADFVIQINSPREVARLLQRVGRAGHKVGLISRGAVLCADPDDVAEATVIRHKALQEDVETPPIPETPLDVLANQLEAMSLEGDIPLNEAVATLLRARPFRHLTQDQAEDVLDLMESTYLVQRQDGELRRRGRARLHFVDNLSMIPDSTTFRVRDVSSRKLIGTLDEAFVASYIEPGALFILKGHPWRVVEFETGDEDEDDDEAPEILAAPVKDPTGAVPSWVGEEIPVPYSVAQDVGRLRQRLDELLRAGADATGWLADAHDLDRATADLLVRSIGDQDDLVVPTHETVTLEIGKQTAVLNACLGHKTNEALGTVLSGLLAARLGQSVGLDTDPYRVMLELPRGTRPEVVHEVLDEITGAPLEALIASLLNNQPILRFKLVHAARKFGVLDKGATATNVNVTRLLERFKDTALHQEAVREVLHERMDIEQAEAFLDQVASGEVELVTQRLSPIGEAGFEESLSLVSPRRATAAILRAIEERLLDEPVVLACLHCKGWKSKTRIRRVSFPIHCPKCNAKMITLLRPWQEDKVKLAQRKETGELAPDKRKDLRRLHAIASLIAAHGKRAALALVARGVGPDTAGRILMRQPETKEDLLREIMEAEVTYARTRAFWD